MSQFKFEPRSEAIILDTVLEGKITLHARLVLDTGASLIVLPWWIATGLNLQIDPAHLIQTTSASMVETVPLTKIPKVTVLGKTVKNVSCLIKDLPAESGVDGLLGLSFLRNFNLEINFKKGILTLE